MCECVSCTNDGKKDWTADHHKTTDVCNVIPMNDDRCHYYGFGCHCKPFKDPDAPDGRIIIIHNSFDGREVAEKLEETYMEIHNNNCAEK